MIVVHTPHHDNKQWLTVTILPRKSGRVRNQPNNFCCTSTYYIMIDHHHPHPSIHNQSSSFSHYRYYLRWLRVSSWFIFSSSSSYLRGKGQVPPPYELQQAPLDGDELATLIFRRDRGVKRRDSRQRSTYVREEDRKMASISITPHTDIITQTERNTKHFIYLKDEGRIDDVSVSEKEGRRNGPFLVSQVFGTKKKKIMCRGLTYY